MAVNEDPSQLPILRHSHCLRHFHKKPENAHKRGGYHHCSLRVSFLNKAVRYQRECHPDWCRNQWGQRGKGRLWQWSFEQPNKQTLKTQDCWRYLQESLPQIQILHSCSRRSRFVDCFLTRIQRSQFLFAPKRPSNRWSLEWIEEQTQIGQFFE